MKFTVLGIPVPQGSMKAFMPKGWTRPILTSDNPKLKQWRKIFRDEALVAMGSVIGMAGKNVALRVELSFFLPRAASNRAIDAIKKPDLDKLARAALDAMTNVVYSDDSQVVELHCFKAYGKPRVEVRVEEVGLVPVMLESQQIEDSQIPFA